MHVIFIQLLVNFLIQKFESVIEPTIRIDKADLLIRLDLLVKELLMIHHPLDEPRRLEDQVLDPKD